jgi:hypothetical protein
MNDRRGLTRYVQAGAFIERHGLRQVVAIENATGTGLQINRRHSRRIALIPERPADVIGIANFLAPKKAQSVRGHANVKQCVTFMPARMVRGTCKRCQIDRSDSIFWHIASAIEKNGR